MPWETHRSGWYPWEFGREYRVFRWSVFPGHYSRFLRRPRLWQVLVLLGSESGRGNPQKLFVSAVSLILAGFLLRINSFLIGYETGDGWSYFPSVPEMLVTFGIIALEVLLYVLFVRTFPVLPRDEQPSAAAAAAR